MSKIVNTNYCNFWKKDSKIKKFRFVRLFFLFMRIKIKVIERNSSKNKKISGWLLKRTRMITYNDFLATMTIIKDF
jgi:hypothetical protein